MDKRKEIVFQKFMEDAQKTIFDPAPFKEEQRRRAGFPRIRRGRRRQATPRQVAPEARVRRKDRARLLAAVSGAGPARGAAEELAADPGRREALLPHALSRGMGSQGARVVKPVVNWPSPEEVGRSAGFVRVGAGRLPKHGRRGAVGLTSFRATAPPTSLDDRDRDEAGRRRRNAPAGWTPDKTYVKR